MSEYCLPPDEVIKVNARMLGVGSNLLDRGKLESALSAPLQIFDGEYLLPSVLIRASALLLYVVKAHAFIDGNKRTAWVCCDTYMKMQGLGLATIPEADIVDLVEKAAGAYDCDRNMIVEWLADRLA